MRLLAATAAIAGVGLVLVIATREVPAGGDRAGESVDRAVGPTARDAPIGAAIAGDEAALARWLAAPDGPREIWLRPRVYHGDFVISRPVALRGVRGSELVGTGRGTVVTIAAQGSELDNVVVRGSGRRNTREDAAIRVTASDVVVRRVHVRDSLFGVSMGPCARCRLEQSHVVGQRDDPLQGDGVKLWEADHAVVRDCLVEDSRDLVVWYSRGVLLERNRVLHGRYGAHFMHAHDSIVRDSTFAHDTVGVFVMYSSGITLERNVLAGARGAAGIGVGFKESDGATLVDNRLVANTVGTYLDRSPRSAAAPVRFARNLFALNETAVRLHSSEVGLEFSGNEFTSNARAAQVEGGGDAMSVTFEGNRWSDYQGYDLDHDGAGDVPHQVKVLSSELLEEVPALKLFEGTLALASIDLIARAAPVLSSRLLLIDASPRVASEGSLR